MTTCLIDADTYVYQSAIASEKEVQWDEDEYTIFGDLAQARELFAGAVEDLTKALAKVVKNPKLILCLSDSAPSFRKAIWPEYKAGRKRRPIVYTPLREWVCNPDTGYEVYLRPALEADDILGILGTHPTIIKGPKVLVSMDKDLTQIPGRLYNPQKDEWHTTDADSGMRQFWMQTLTGDSTDNYPGCPGIGAVRAERLLDKAEGDPWPAIVAAYEKAGLTEEDAIVQARTARILQADDYDFKRKEPILWSPDREH